MNYPEYVPPLEKHEAGLTMRTVGWLLLVFDAMFILVFAPGSLRDGSALWVVWGVAQALVGLVLIGEGSKKVSSEEVIPGSIIAMPPRYRPEEPSKAA